MSGQLGRKGHRVKILVDTCYVTVSMHVLHHNVDTLLCHNVDALLHHSIDACVMPQCSFAQERCLQSPACLSACCCLLACGVGTDNCLSILFKVVAL